MRPDVRWLFLGMGVKRWILGLLVGIGMISLGIGYLLVAVYRAAPLPDYFYYLTLQFVPREIRGILFMGIGILLTSVSVVQINRAILQPFLDRTGDDKLVDILYRHRALSRGPTVVCVSGGPGLSVAMRGLRNETANLWGITLSHGPAKTRTELGLLHDRVLVASNDDLSYATHLADGTILEGEAALLSRKSGDPICRVEVRRNDGLDPEANPEACAVLRKADAIIIGPGDLWGAIVPSLLVPDVAQAIRESEAKKIFVCNIMTQAGRTNSFSVADHVRAIQEAANIQVDYIVVNDSRPSEKLLRAYREARQSQVVFDPVAAGHLSQVTFANTADKFVLIEGAFMVEADVMTDINEEMFVDREGREGHRRLQVVRHDPEKLGLALSKLINAETWRRKSD